MRKCASSSSITAAIIDDEKIARKVIRKLLTLHCTCIEIIGEAHNIKSAQSILLEKKPDLVFLDVHLAEENSFNLLSSFDTIPFEIIFTSGDLNYGVPAFKVNAIDFVLKPIDGDDLESAVEKATLRIQEKKSKSHEEVRVSIHANDSVAYVSASEICSLIANDNYTQIITLDNKRYTASKTLGTLEKELNATNQFIRIHRSICINLHNVLSYTKTNPCSIKLKNGCDYEISRRKKSEILSVLKK